MVLTVADGRFPAGGHAHSGGLEEAVGAGRVRTGGDLLSFLRGRLHTVGALEAALGACAWMLSPSIAALEQLTWEAAARVPSEVLRQVSVAQGRNLLRTVRAMWPESQVGWLATLASKWPAGLFYPVALGAVGRSTGLSAQQSALIAAQGAVSTPAWAATRLVGLSPFEVGRCLVTLSPEIAKLAVAAERAARYAFDHGDLAALPSFSAPLTDMGAQAHSQWEVRLFAS